MTIKGVVDKVEEDKDGRGEFSIITSVEGRKIRVRGSLPKNIEGANFVYDVAPINDPEDSIGLQRERKDESILYQLQVNSWVCDINRYCGYWIN